MSVTIVKKRLIALAAFLGAATTMSLLCLLLYTDHLPALLPLRETSLASSSVDLAKTNIRVNRRVHKIRKVCAAEDAFEREYGRTNLRMSRAYEGSHFKMQQFLLKALRGERVVVSAIGGSITEGHMVYQDEVWFKQFYNWLQDFIGNDVDIVYSKGGVPAVGSDYFSLCFPRHLPADSDLVLVELAVNDEGLPEHVENMENLIRGLLDLEKDPAVMLVEAMAFSTGGMGGGGGRMHLPVAQYYDVPVVNQRHPIANHFGRFPELVAHYFAIAWGEVDTRHMNKRGHRDLGMLVAAFIQHIACEMVADPDFAVPTAPTKPSITSGLLPPHGTAQSDVPQDVDVELASTIAIEQYAQLRSVQAGWPEQARSWALENDPTGLLMPGMFTSPHEYGIMPRQTVLDGWNPSLDAVVPRIHPQCLTSRTKDRAYMLTPIATQGWMGWAHESHPDKPYLVAQVPGSWAKFQVTTSLGTVKMYSLKSGSLGLGIAECWIGDDRHLSVEINGYWTSNANIGRFDVIREGLPAGEHILTCELLHKTSDPEGGTDFRMISIMSI